jgi:hypothetical protein
MLLSTCPPFIAIPVVGLGSQRHQASCQRAMNQAAFEAIGISLAWEASNAKFFY